MEALHHLKSRAVLLLLLFYHYHRLIPQLPNVYLLHSLSMFNLLHMILLKWLQLITSYIWYCWSCSYNLFEITNCFHSYPPPVFITRTSFSCYLPICVWSNESYLKWFDFSKSTGCKFSNFTRFITLSTETQIEESNLSSAEYLILHRISWLNSISQIWTRWDICSQPVAKKNATPATTSTVLPLVYKYNLIYSGMKLPTFARDFPIVGSKTTIYYAYVANVSTAFPLAKQKPKVFRANSSDSESNLFYPLPVLHSSSL